MGFFLDLLGIAGGVIAIAGAIYSAIALISSARVKNYATTQQIDKILDNQEKMAGLISDLSRDLDRDFEAINEKLIEIKAFMIYLRKINGGTSH